MMIVEVGESPYDRNWVRLVIVQGMQPDREDLARKCVERALKPGEKIWRVTKVDFVIDLSKE